MRIKHTIFGLTVAALLAGGCSYLDPLPDGSYNDENFDDYPELLRGFVDKVYADYFPAVYYSTYYAGLAAATDDAVYRSETAMWRSFSKGNARMDNNPFASKWNNDYTAINYLNLFLKDNVGFNTRYLVDFEADRAYRHCQQGSAFGLRAWLHFDLLRAFAGKGIDGNMWGVPLMLTPSEAGKMDNNSVRRATVDECVAQILKDCDSASVHLPYNNRDYPGDPTQSVQVTGAIRYRTMDQVIVDGLRAMVYLFWASPAFNPSNDMSRYENAAKYAAKVMKHKLEVESTLAGGFDPLKKFRWDDTNSPEIVWCSTFSSSTATETAFYPREFGGAAQIAPSQDLVDAFPMKNGYPIFDSRSGYDPENPYKDRDPRFYSAIYYDGANVVRDLNGEVMYTFEVKEGGKDAPAEPTCHLPRTTSGSSRNGWNKNDQTVESGYRCVHMMNWTHICLIFAEAANKAVGPQDETTFGYSAKQAIKWLRSRPSNDGVAGVGSESDPYLDECAAAGASKFDELVRNEWRLETCFEGDRYYNLRRWAGSVDEVNVAVHGAKISADGKYQLDNVVETLRFPSLWAPIPYSDIRRCGNLVQNEGWETWR
ncbi:MAG: RagB/SusD family nutrient uptake outer membrane protein [Anaerovoracaceae bacterium]